MQMKLKENLKEKIEEIENITGADYEITNDFIEIENLITIIEDLLCEIHCLEEKFEDYKQMVEDNYERIPYEEEI